MSARLLHDLGLGTAASIDALASRTKSFELIHTGTQDLPIGTLLDRLGRDDGLRPPRTGHLGNWAEIALGRSGPMDFNSAICGSGYGFPMIYGFTRTEAEAEGGDDAYLPGSVVDRGERRQLPLYTWDGHGFARRDRSRPLFCALTQTEVDGALVPLAELQWQRMLTVDGYRFKHWAAFLIEHEALVVNMLCVLLEEAGRRENARRAFSELVSHSVRLDGEVDRCELRSDGTGYILDGHRYPSARALAEAVLLTARALVEPRPFFARIADLPPVLPVMSLQLSTALFGLLRTHYPEGSGAAADRPFITHPHWGARAMAGCPPRRGGYLAEKSRVRSLRLITEPLVRHFAEVDPLCFVLLPAQVFMLCPPDTAPGDVDLLAGLFRAVHAAGPDASYETTLAWLDTHHDRLSEYLRSRFRAGSGVRVGGTPREAARAVEPDGFRQLTFRQASGAVAAFEEMAA